MDRHDAESRRSRSAVCEELKMHTTLEDEVFYPAARGDRRRRT